eukprot:SAG11_NODE_3494_length_2413_cov_1.810285_5_plen_126_part_00
MLFGVMLPRITTLRIKYRISKGGAHGSAMCSELMQFPEEVIGRINSYGLEAFLQRNDEKRITVLEEKCKCVWSCLKDAVYNCPEPNMADDLEVCHQYPHMHDSNHEHHHLDLLRVWSLHTLCSDL